MLTSSSSAATTVGDRGSIIERTRAAIDRAVANLRARQEPDGHWAGDYGGPLFLLPGLVIACEITGTDLGEPKRERMMPLWALGRYHRLTRT